jgi:hypothetical protein
VCDRHGTLSGKLGTLPAVDRGWSASMSSQPKGVPVPPLLWSEGGLGEGQPSFDIARVPWSRHTPTPWRAVRGLRVAVVCDGEDAPKPLTECLIRDGHRAYWTSRSGLIASLREPNHHDHPAPALDAVVISARLLLAPDGDDLLSALHDKCAGASVVLLGSDTLRKGALVRDLRRCRTFQEVVTLDSPADVDDLRMVMMNVPARRAQSGFRRGEP